jgi:hypothetical protein
MLAKLLRRTTICSILSVEAIARAQDPTATALFKAGKELEAQGNYKDACPKFEASYKHEAALGTLMNMADCHEKIGVLAQAWSEWSAAYDRARKEGDLPRGDLSKKRLDALEPRIPKMKIVVAGTAPDLAVWRDDRALDSLEYGVELPVELGKHVITVRRGDKVLTTEEQTAAEAAHLTVNVDLGKVAAENPRPKDEPPLKPVIDRPSTKKRATIWATVAPITIGAGGTVLAGGLVFEIVALGLKNNKDCATEPNEKTVCTQSGLDKIDTARNASLAGTFLIIGGAGVVAAGLVLYLVMPKEKAVVGRLPVLTPTAGGMSLSWGGVF